ncbi:MAG: helix-turn-helix domain-containing protein [Terriglobia bacterium]|jgi:excisionase family DNA binding protein
MPPSTKSGFGGERRLFTVKEAAAYLAVPVATLYTRIFYRQVPFVKLGRSVRFDRADLDALIDANKVHPEEGR